MTEFITYDPKLFKKRELEDVRLITELRVKLPHIRKAEAEFTLQSFIDAMDVNRPFGKRVASFIAGESKLSRGIGGVIDFVTIFVPFGRKIDKGRDALRLVLQRKTKQDERMDKIKGWIAQPSTKAGLIVLASIGTVFGLDLNPELLEEAVTQVVTGAALVVAGATALWEMFRKEKE